MQYFYSSEFLAAAKEKCIAAERQFHNDLAKELFYEPPGDGTYTIPPTKPWYQRLGYKIDRLWWKLRYKICCLIMNDDIYPPDPDPYYWYDNLRMMKRNICPLCRKEIPVGWSVLPSLVYENVWYHSKCATNKLKELYSKAIVDIGSLDRERPNAFLNLLKESKNGEWIRISLDLFWINKQLIS